LDRGFFSECQHPSGEFPVIEKNRNSPSQWQTVNISKWEYSCWC
jgi:hypothetical protein